MGSYFNRCIAGRDSHGIDKVINFLVSVDFSFCKFQKMNEDLSVSRKNLHDKLV